VRGQRGRQNHRLLRATLALRTAEGAEGHGGDGPGDSLLRSAQRGACLHVALDANALLPRNARRHLDDRGRGDQVLFPVRRESFGEVRGRKTIPPVGGRGSLQAMPMTRSALVLGLVLAGASLAAQVAPSDPRTALRKRAEGETPLINDTFELCDCVGGRITGSAPMDRAIRWATEKLKAAGVDS